MFLYREGYYEKDKKPDSSGNTQVIIAKNRQGSIGIREFKLDFNHMFFSETESNINE
jgi:replicative DNA helicase